jgi:pimeloyl-ACP methyl ester carboxylesterase
VIRSVAAVALATVALVLASGAGGAADPLVATVYPAPRPLGVMVTSGGWAYCEQLRALARRTSYTLLCGRYAKDGYTGLGLREKRQLDWGDPAYLARLAASARALHEAVGGRLLLVGVSYSGFGVATLAAHHPELRPDRLIVIDAYLDLAARRRRLPDRHETAREIDRETGGLAGELRRRSASAAGLARLVRAGTRLTVVSSVSEHERRFFNGATCARDASAETLAQLARSLGRPVPAWVTNTRHGVNLWRHGRAIVGGRPPGRQVTFRPDGVIPPGSVCRG